MAVLNDLFKVSYDRIGIQQLPCAVCSSAPYGIRFQIGGNEEIYLGDHRKPNGAYIENAVDRAPERSHNSHMYVIRCNLPGIYPIPVRFL